MYSTAFWYLFVVLLVFLALLRNHCYSFHRTKCWTGYGLSPLCPKGYMISWEFVNRVFPARLIWFSRWILFVLQVHKSNDYDVPCCLAIANNWALKQDCVHFVFCPKQANKIDGVVLNRVCILGCFVLNRASVKSSAAHLHPNIGRVPTHGFVVSVTTVIAPILP